MEFWAVVGLACIDDQFREDLEEAAKADNSKLLYDYLKDGWHFRLTRSQVEEVRHIMKCNDALDGMKSVRECWSKACSVGSTYKADYKHPDPGWKGIHILAINTETGETTRYDD